MKKPVVILGAGGWAREIYDVMLDLHLDVLGWVVDPKYAKCGTIINGKPVLGGFDWLEGKGNTVEAVAAVGTSDLRWAFVRKCLNYGVRFTNVVSPTCYLSPWATIGRGVQIAQHCIVRSQAVVGAFAQINLGCSICHDVVLEPFVSMELGVNVPGNVRIKYGAYIGSNATFLTHVTVGEWSRVGAGAVVLQDVPANATVVGNPAKVVRMREPGWHLEAYANL